MTTGDEARTIADTIAAEVQRVAGKLTDMPDAVVEDRNGRIVVTWPDGRGRWARVTPELIEQWAATVNRHRDERDSRRADMRTLTERHDDLIEALCRLIPEDAGDDVAIEAIIVKWFTEQAGEIARLRELLDTILGSFNQAGHPGTPSHRTGWVRDEVLEAWRAAVRIEP
jgi:hypothetical protein